MAKVSIPGFVCMYRSQYGNDHFAFFTFDASKSDKDYILVGPLTVEYEVPATFNPVAAQVASLQAQREAAGREFAATVRRIDEQISKLTAIGCDGVPS